MKYEQLISQTVITLSLDSGVGLAHIGLPYKVRFFKLGHKFRNSTCLISSIKLLKILKSVRSTIVRERKPLKIYPSKSKHLRFSNREHGLKSVISLYAK